MKTTIERLLELQRLFYELHINAGLGWIDKRHKKVSHDGTEVPDHPVEQYHMVLRDYLEKKELGEFQRKLLIFFGWFLGILAVTLEGVAWYTINYYVNRGGASDFATVVVVGGTFGGVAAAVFSILTFFKSKDVAQAWKAMLENHVKAEWTTIGFADEVFTLLSWLHQKEITDATAPGVLTLLEADLHLDLHYDAIPRKATVAFVDASDMIALDIRYQQRNPPPPSGLKVESVDAKRARFKRNHMIATNWGVPLAPIEVTYTRADAELQKIQARTAPAFGD